MTEYLESITGLPVTKRISSRAKKLHLAVTAAGKIELVCPHGVSARRAQMFLMKNASWVSRQRASMDQRRKEFPFDYPDLEGVSRSCTLLGMQQSLTLCLEECSKRTFTVGWDRENNSIVVCCSGGLAAADRQKMFLRWLYQLALSEITLMVAQEATKLGCWPKGIGLKSYKQKWGLLNPDDHMFIHWHLIFAPKDVLRYVVVHELCHLKERNHSSRFYRHVQNAMPGYQWHEQWLRRYGFILQSDSSIERGVA